MDPGQPFNPRDFLPDWVFAPRPGPIDARWLESVAHQGYARGQLHWDDEAVAVPTAGGLVMSREEWRAVAAAVEWFYTQVESGQIDAFNAGATAREENTRAICNRIRETRRDWKGLRSGLYLVTDGEGLYKIGRSVAVLERFEAHCREQRRPLELLAVIACDDQKIAEADLHARFQERRVRGEWFALTTGEVGFITRLTRWPEER